MNEQAAHIGNMPQRPREYWTTVVVDGRRFISHYNADSARWTLARADDDHPAVVVDAHPKGGWRATAYTMPAQSVTHAATAQEAIAASLAWIAQN